MTDHRLSTDAWGTPDYADRIEELCEMGDYAAVDRALVAAYGDTVRWQGREYDTAALLSGRLVERPKRLGRWKSRGWGPRFPVATWEEE